MKHKNSSDNICNAVGKAVFCATAVVCAATIFCACFVRPCAKKLEKRLRAAYDISPEDY